MRLYNHPLHPEIDALVRAQRERNVCDWDVQMLLEECRQELDRENRQGDIDDALDWQGRVRDAAP